MSGDVGPDDRLASVELDDADDARIEYLSRDTSGLTEDEAERIVRFAKLPREERSPTMLRMNGKEPLASKASQDATSDSSTGQSNGSGGDGDRHTNDDVPGSGSNIDGGMNTFCRKVRRDLREADRPTEVIEQFPDKHPSAIFRHAEGRCACDTDADPTTSPRVQADECADMRRAFRHGGTKRDVMAEFHRSANAVNKHLFGRCNHKTRQDSPVNRSLSKSECAHLREAFRRNESVSGTELAEAYGISSSSCYRHLRGVCDHDVDVDPVPPLEVDAETCRGMRKDFKRDPRAVVAHIARDHDTTRRVAHYHIYGKCSCDTDEDPAPRR